MSITIVLIPVAIALSITVKESISVQIRQKNKAHEPVTQLAPMQTIFNDALLLEQTLQEHGFAVTIQTENQMICQIGETQLVYSRSATGEPFWVSVLGIQDIDGCITEMECFEQEYQRNVQSYTYNKLVANLHQSNMAIASETILEDNSIMLTIDTI